MNKTPLHPDHPVPVSEIDLIQIGPFSITLRDTKTNTDDWNLATQTGQLVLDGQADHVLDSADSTGFGAISVRPEEKLKSLLRLNDVLAGNVDPDAVFPKILDVLFDIFPQADRGAIVLNPEDATRMATVAQRRRIPGDDQTVRISRVILKNVLAGSVAILSTNTRTDPRVCDSESIRSEAVHSAMCVAMMNVEGEPFGVINLDSQSPTRRFESNDLQILVAIARQASLAYENSRLLKLEVERQRQAYEMRTAAEIQRRLVPEVMPTVTGYEFFGSYDAAKVVGGDYYDCFSMPHGKICVSFGDVAGKGFPAALIMARLSGIVRNTMQYTDNVAVAMTQINSLMCSGMVEGRFVTYILGVLDPVAHTLTFANAGHMAPVVRHPDDTLSAMTSDHSGPVIGIAENYAYETVEVPLKPGEIVVLRTDGVDEAMAQDDQFYGEQRFHKRVLSASPDPAAICRTILTDVKSFMPPGKQNDDITLFAFRRSAN